MEEFVPFPSFVKQLQTPQPGEDAEQRRKREYLAEHYQRVKVVHSFMADDRQCIDCIEAGSQPGLQGQGLPATPPAFAPMPGLPSTTVGGESPQLAMPRVDRHGHVMQCPPGTIPVQRVTLEQLDSAGTLEEYFQKSPGGGALPPTGGAARGTDGLATS